MSTSFDSQDSNLLPMLVTRIRERGISGVCKIPRLRIRVAIFMRNLVGAITQPTFWAMEKGLGKNTL